MSNSLPADGETSYPRGGSSVKAGGEGIFLGPSGESLRLWVDPRIRSARNIIKAAETELAEISVDNDEPETQLLLLHPTSYRLFDGFCHPEWYPPRRKREYYAALEAGKEVDQAWKRKVMLKESWVDRCVAAGRFMGEEDDWAGCRVGGPPVVDVAKDVTSAVAPVPFRMSTVAPPMMQEVVIEEAPEALPETAASSIPSIPSLSSERLLVDDMPVEQDLEKDHSADRNAASTANDNPVAESPQAQSPSQPSRKRRKPNSDENGRSVMLDISMLDSGPSSRFQSPPAEVASQVVLPPPQPSDVRIFEDLSFYVDLATKNRSDILKELKGAGGTIAVDYPDATHVLVSKYQVNKSHWNMLVAEHAPKGIWFVYREWAKKSLEEKRRLPEIDHCVPKGELAAIAARAREIGQGSNANKDGEISKTSPTTHSDQLLKEVHEAKASLGLETERDVAKHLHGKHGIYDVKKWAGLYREWARRNKPAQSPIASKSRSMFRTLEESPLRVKEEAVTTRESQPTQRMRIDKMSMDKEELDVIFEREHAHFIEQCGSKSRPFARYLVDKYGAYDVDGWWTQFGDWTFGTGHWSMSPRAASRSLHAGSFSPTPSDRSLERLPVVDDSRPTTRPPGTSTRLPTEFIAVTLSEMDVVHKGKPSRSAADLSAELSAKYPAYSDASWRNLVWDWRNGRGRFEGCGRRWDGLEDEQDHRQDAVHDHPAPDAGIVKQEPSRTSSSPSKGTASRLSKEKLEKIFSEQEWRLATEFANSVKLFAEYLAATYGTLKSSTWQVYYGYWNGGQERWAGHPRAGMPDVGPSSSRKTSLPPTRAAAPAAVPISDNYLKSIRKAIEHCPKGGSASAELAQKFTQIMNPDRLADPKADSTFMRKIGSIKPPALPLEMSMVVMTWVTGEDRWTPVGPLWDGKTTRQAPSDPKAGPSIQQPSPSGAAGPAAGDESAGISTTTVIFRGPYSEEEELAMSQFAQSVRDRGEKVSYRSWQEFAETYPHRKPGTWAQQYNVHKARIDAIAGTSESGSTAVTETDVSVKSEIETDQSPTQSATSNTPLKSALSRRARKNKQKGERWAASKQEYEALARFIVDNVAEGDVPTTAHFKQFSLDHPERDSASWQIIWHRDKFRATLLPLVEQYRREVNAPGTSNRSRPKTYTEEDEQAMAEFIVQSVPSDRPPKASDWVIFQRNHQKRSAPSWAEHYRVFKPRISGMVTALRGEAEPATKDSQLEVIELGSDEEEEEEVEEIVPVRPTWSTRSGWNNDPIVIDDD